MLWYIEIFFWCINVDFTLTLSPLSLSLSLCIPLSVLRCSLQEAEESRDAGRRDLIEAHRQLRDCAAERDAQRKEALELRRALGDAGREKEAIHNSNQELRATVKRTENDINRLGISHQGHQEDFSTESHSHLLCLHELDIQKICSYVPMFLVPIFPYVGTSPCRISHCVSPPQSEAGTGGEGAEAGRAGGVQVLQPAGGEQAEGQAARAGALPSAGTPRAAGAAQTGGHGCRARESTVVH